MIKSFFPIPLLLFFYTFLSVLLTSPSSLAAVPLNINSEDRILIFAPHPDDEIIGTAGVIQRAKQIGANVKIIYLTNGDSNELAFMIYKKYPILTRKGLLRMGETRRLESINAAESLGIEKDNLIFLGYPDSGIMSIFTKYWGKDKPYSSMLAHVKAVPYNKCLSPGAPYIGDSILEDIKFVLSSYKPTKIFVTNPVDTNGDHRAAFLFLQIALWDLKASLNNPDIFPFTIHAVGWPVPRGAHPELTLEPPLQLKKSDINWSKLELSKFEIINKIKAIEIFKTQNAYNPKYLFSFARKNELFGGYPDILLYENNEEPEINWVKLEKLQNNPSFQTDEDSKHPKIIKSIAYAKKKDHLLVRVNSKNWKDNLLGISLYLFGYRDDVNFNSMPKYRIYVSFDKKIKVYEKRKHLKETNIQLQKSKNGFIIVFPIKDLGDPDRVLSCVKTHISKTSEDLTAWRTLLIKDN